MEENPKHPLPENEYNLTQQEEHEWQELIDSVHTTDVPFHILKNLRVHMADGTRLIFPVADWLEQGEDLDYIEDRITGWYQKNEDLILGSDFVVDLAKIKDTVTGYTKKTLKDLE